MNLEPPAVLEKIKDLLPKGFYKDPQELRITQLHGDASNRIYFRIQSATQKLILMQRPMVGKESASEEITKQKEKPKEYPFINIQRFLKSQHFPVPEILAVSLNEEFLFLEDLGEITFEKAVLKAKEGRSALYEDAIKLLNTWQHLKNHHCVAFEREFDPDLFDWEFEHFLEWGVEKSQNITIPQKDRAELTKIFHDISLQIIPLKQTLTHRDYQSRNIMVVDKKMVVLDFQDALRGPYIYDLVALLRDSYIELSTQEVTHLVNFYADLSGQNRTQVTNDFHLQTIQRKLKDGGRFHYIHLFKGNPGFLPYVAASFRYAHDALKQRPEGRKVIPILGKYLVEFAK